MTIEQVVCVPFGAIIQAVVFGLGVAVGISLTQRGIENVNNNSKKTIDAQNNGVSANSKPQGCAAAPRARRAKA